jgi:sugar lactone lactonase YvrE
MKSVVAVSLLAAIVAVSGAGAVGSHRPGARLLAEPPALAAGQAWNARFTVLRAGRPLAGLAPRFWVRGPASRSFAARGLGRGRYAARVVFPVAGRYRLGITVEEFSLQLGTVTVRAPAVTMRAPLGLAVGPDGAVYVADVQGTTVVRVDPRTRARTVVARDLDNPVDVAFDREGRLLVVDSTDRVFRVAPGGVRVLVAGTGTRAHTGDGGPATAASLGGSGGMDVDAQGNLVVAEYDGWIRVVQSDGTIGTLAGNGTEGYAGDGGPAARSVLRHPHDVAVMPDGSIVVADSHNQAIRRIAPNGIITTMAAGLEAPVGVAPAPNGAVYVAEAVGRVTLVRRDGGTARVATGTTPFGIASDAAGNVYFSELEAHRVKRVDAATGAVTIMVQ